MLCWVICSCGLKPCRRTYCAGVKIKTNYIWINNKRNKKTNGIWKHIQSTWYTYSYYSKYRHNIGNSITLGQSMLIKTSREPEVCIVRPLWHRQQQTHALQETLQNYLSITSVWVTWSVNIVCHYFQLFLFLFHNNVICKSRHWKCIIKWFKLVPVSNN